MSLCHFFEELKATGSAPAGEARSLPFEAYINIEIYEKERNTIFHGDWVFVCAEKELPKEGDYFVFILAEEPLVVIRGKDGKLRALSNVCRHRGTIINDSGFGNSKRFVCPYHAWTYTDKGQLIGIPFPGDREINKSDHCLPRFSLEVWEGLVFVNLDDKPDAIRDRLSGIESYFQLFKTDRFKHAYSEEAEN